MSNTHERQLVKEYVDAKTADKLAKENAKNAATRLAIAEAAVVEHLEGTECTATASYQGMGRVQLNKPRLYASVKSENYPALRDFLTVIQRGDLIVEKIHPQTLSAFVSERIELGEEVPESITYYLKPQLRIY